MRWGLARTGFLLTGLLVVPLFGADFWEAKEHTSWSEKECRKLLTKSPWAFSNSFRRPSNIGSTLTGERETTEILEFRLLTAKPIRMAFAQLQLLQNPENEALTEQVEQYINTSAGPEIVVQISYRAIPAASGYLQDLHTFFGHATLASFFGNTVLQSDEGVAVPISGYLPWSQQRPNPAFVFPRFDEDGEPFFTGREKSIGLRSEFEIQVTVHQPGGLPQINPRKYKIFIKMKPKEMFYQGEFAL